jgi:Cu2+-exporting ATPase
VQGFRIRKSNYSRTKLGKTVSYISVDGIAVGFVSITDAIKATSVETIKELIRQGVEVIMLTDNENTAKAVAQELHLSSIKRVVCQKTS